jgi:hypothetical protein
VLDVHRRLECRRIRSRADYDAVFRLRYRAYVDNQLIEPNDGGISIDGYDLLENCQIFGLFMDGRLVSSLRTHLVTAENPNCPTMLYFRESILPKVREGYSFVDGSRFCVEPTLVAETSALPFLTVRIAYMASVHFGSDYNMSVVRDGHGAFYRRYFGFEKWAGGVQPDWYRHPVDLYVANMHQNQEAIESRMPFMRSSAEERTALFTDQFAEQNVPSVKGLYGNQVTNRGPGIDPSTDLSTFVRVAAEN